MIIPVFIEMVTHMERNELGLNLSQNCTFLFSEKYKSLGGITRPGSLGVLSAYMESDVGSNTKKAPL